MAKLVSELIHCECEQCLLSLTAQEGNDIVGHVIFSSAFIEGQATFCAYILAPLAVKTCKQGKGIGNALIKQGLQKLKQQGVDIILVVGDPNFYSQVGLKSMHKLVAPFVLEYPQAWMALELTAGTLLKTSGKIMCVDPFMAPEHW